MMKGSYLIILSAVCILTACLREISAPPLASFTIQNNNCNAPCTVAFTNTSKNASRFEWHFGEQGSSSAARDPSFIYNTAGEYTVKLTASDEGVSHSVQQTITIKGPNPAKVWDKTFGGGDVDYLRVIVPTPDGGFLLGGESYSGQSGDKSENLRGNFDYWVIKIGANGTKQWDKTFGGNGYDRLNAMVTTADGGFLLGGHSDSNQSGDKSENSRGNADYWVVKIDANGTRQWDKTFGGSSSDVLISMSVSADGGFLLRGTSDSNQGGDKSENLKGDSDYWIIKISANGDKQWDKTFGGSDYDALNAMAVTPDGEFLLQGRSHSGQSGNNPENSKGGADYRVVKIGADGTKQWDKTFGGNGEDYLTAVTVASDGGFLLAGMSDSNQNGDKSENSRGGSDYWVIKISANGTKQWDKTFGGNQSDFLTSVTATSDGGLLLAGSSVSDKNGDKSESPKGAFDYWVVKVSANGTKQWDKTFGGSYPDFLSSTVTTPDGGFLLGGYSDSGQNGDKSENSRGNSDYWVIKIK